MTTLRIIYDNAVDRVTTGNLTASNSVSGLPVTNLQIDRKSKIWRGTGTSVTLTCKWDIAELLSGLAFPFCNFSPTATAVIRLYDAVTAGTLLYTSTTTLLAPAVTAGYWGSGTMPLGINAYSYGYNPYGRVWFDAVYLAKRMEVDIVDTSNVSGYLEIARMVAGNHWSPTYNTTFGIPVTFPDLSINTRTQSGDLVSSIGIRTKRMSVDLAWMLDNDRTMLSYIMQKNGITKPIFISVFPLDEDTSKEQMYQVYGKPTGMSAISHTVNTIYSSQLELEEI